MNLEAAEGVQPKAGGPIPVRVRSSVFVEEEMDCVCSVVPGDTVSWGVKSGRQRENQQFKGVLHSLPVL